MSNFSNEMDVEKSTNFESGWYEFLAVLSDVCTHSENYQDHRFRYDDGCPKKISIRYLELLRDKDESYCKKLEFVEKERDWKVTGTSATNCLGGK